MYFLHVLSVMRYIEQELIKREIGGAAYGVAPEGTPPHINPT